MLKALVEQRNITEEEILRAVQQNKQRADELKLSLEQQHSPPWWKKWAWKLGIIALIYYVFSSSQSPQPVPQPGRPQYWKP